MPQCMSKSDLFAPCQRCPGRNGSTGNFEVVQSDNGSQAQSEDMDRTRVCREKTEKTPECGVEPQTSALEGQRFSH